MAVEVNVGAQKVSVDLHALKNKSGTLYLQGGEIKESKFSLGRSFLGLFSPSIRQQNKNALQALTTAMHRFYGAVPSTAENLSKISGSDVKRMMNRARLEGFIGEMQTQYGRFAHSSLKELRGMQDKKLERVLNNDTRTRVEMTKVKKASNEMEARGLENLGQIMREGNLSPRETITALRDIPRFGVLLDKPMAPGQGLTVGKQTEQVLSLYEQQKGHYGLKALDAESDTFSMDRFMKTVLAFHEIGKGDPEGISSWEIMSKAMDKMGFNSREVRLAESMLLRNVAQELQIDGFGTIDGARSSLSNLVRKTGFSSEAILTMHTLFTVSVAGSTPSLSEYLETDQNGKLGFVDNKLDDPRLLG